jgi:ferredoxin
MPKISIHGRPETFQTDLLTSILNILLRNRFPIDTICGGKAQCGRCLIRVRSGATMLSPLREREGGKLAELGAGSDSRLACQCYARGDVEIEVVNIRAPSGSA